MAVLHDQHPGMVIYCSCLFLLSFLSPAKKWRTIRDGWLRPGRQRRGKKNSKRGHSKKSLPPDIRLISELNKALQKCLVKAILLLRNYKLQDPPKHTGKENNSHSMSPTAWGTSFEVDDYTQLI